MNLDNINNFMNTKDSDLDFLFDSDKKETKTIP